MEFTTSLLKLVVNNSYDTLEKELEKNQHCKEIISEIIPQANATLLHIATSKGHFKTVQVLVNFGADIHALDSSECTPLFAAVGGSGPMSTNHHKTVNFLIEKGGNVNIYDGEGLSPLHEAANNGDIEMLKILIGAGAKVNHQAISGTTALHFAASGALQRPDFYQILNVPMTASGSDIKKSFHQFALKLHPDKHNTNASETDNKKLLQEFQRIQIAYQVLSDPESKDIYDHTYERCTEYLLSSGIDPCVTTKSKHPETAFELAIRFKQWGVAFTIDTWMVQQDGSFHGNVDQRSRTLLHHLIATKSNQHWIMSVLEHENMFMQTMEKDSHGQTPFLLACSMADVETVSNMLNKAKQDKDTNLMDSLIQSKTEENETPLICATKAGSKSMIELLLEYGADKSLKDTSDSTALNWAEMYGDEHLYELLKE